MPTYEYECRSCGHHLEKFQSIVDKPLKKCPECGKRTLERLIGAGGGILFKGSGFYETDYRSQSYREGARKDTDKGSSSTSSSSSSSKEGASGTSSPSKPSKPSQGGGDSKKMKAAG